MPKRKPSKNKRSTASRGNVSLSARLTAHVARIGKFAVFGLLAVSAVVILLTAAYRLEIIRPISTLMIAQKLTGGEVTRNWIEIDEVAPALKQSVIMSEDGQFCAHNGVDWAAINLVISDALEGERPRGASTITMQTAKNLFLWNGRSYLRKALEIPVALWIDLALPKKRIAEIYLNIAEWGPGIFGIEAAAQHHFGRNAGRLNRQQSALLAVTLPNPHLRDPAKPSAGLNRLARTIRARAEKSGAYVRCLS